MIHQLTQFCQDMHSLGYPEAQTNRLIRSFNCLDDAALLKELPRLLAEAKAESTQTEQKR